MAVVSQLATERQTVQAPAGVVAGPLIVATDGTLQSDAAIRMAYVLAESSGAAVHVVAVMQAIPVPAPDMGLPTPSLVMDDERRAELLDRVSRQVTSVTGAAVHWPVDIEHGHPPRTIVRVARARGASLIILGLGRHRMIDRLIGSETAVQVLRLTTLPVLAVAPDHEGRPRRAVAAVDFSDLSVAAAQVGLDVLDSDGTLHLVHVNTGSEDLLDGRADESRLAHAWERVTMRLGAQRPGRINTLSLSGAAARELLAFAQATRADLIVAGTHGRGTLQRLVLGSVATQLLRGAECSVLVTPLARGRTHEHPPEDGASTDDAEFAYRLERFTRRNMGRRCSLEVDDPELGAQQQALDYPFLGAAYDRSDRRVTLWLGDAGSGARHLTRSIGAVTSIRVLADRDGCDRVLQVAHGEGQTLLTVAK
jgi:nucleotide-binding universal stress UspA family protein